MKTRVARLAGAGLVAAALATTSLLFSPGLAHAESKEECKKMLDSIVSDLTSAGQKNATAISEAGIVDIAAAARATEAARFLLYRAGNTMDSYNKAGCNR